MCSKLTATMSSSVSNYPHMWPLLAAIFVAVVLWGWVFGLGGLNFWLKMSISVALLATFSLLINHHTLAADYAFHFSAVPLGLGVAAALYFIFWFGGIVLRALLPPSDFLIRSVYDTKVALPDWAIALLLAAIIGPGEEVFWRGLVQKRLIALTSPAFGLVLSAALYALVHFWAGNAVLILAAFLVGVVWGYFYLKSGSLIGPMISHAVWDVVIFVLLPLA